MRYMFVALLLLITSVIFSQTIIGPSWEGTPDLKFAKVIIRDAANKIISEKYKDSKVYVEASQGKGIWLTIDVPDHFFIKEAVITKTSYEHGDGAESISYIAKTFDKLVSISFVFKSDDYSGNVSYVIIIYDDNTLKKGNKLKTITLQDNKG